MTRPVRNNTPGKDSAALLDLLQCVGRALQEGARQRAALRGLLNVHWQVLWFLRAANRYSNTLQVLARYLGQTKGSVSQSVQLLERRGYLRRTPDEQDRRVMRLCLTAAGENLLGEIVTDSAWDNATRILPPGAASEASVVLTTLLRQWQRAGGGASFGVCHSCAHFQIEGPRRFRCGLTGERLDLADSEKICGEHRFV